MTHRATRDKPTKSARMELHDLPNVNGTGIGQRKVDGEYTHEVVLRVYVDEKVPADELADDEVVPDTVEDVKTDVIQRDRTPIPESVDPESLSTSKGHRTEKYRPATGGIQLHCPAKGSWGSHGANFWDANHAQPVGLTCRHTFHDSFDQEPYPDVNQPYDGSDHGLGTVVDASSTDNDVTTDALTFSIDDGDASNRMLGLGSVVDIVHPQVGWRVIRFGYRTGLSGDRIRSVDDTIDTGDVILHGMATLDTHGQSGDSGALYGAVDVYGNVTAVGLHFGRIAVDGANKGLITGFDGIEADPAMPALQPLDDLKVDSTGDHPPITSERHADESFIDACVRRVYYDSSTNEYVCSITATNVGSQSGSTLFTINTTGGTGLVDREISLDSATHTAFEVRIRDAYEGESLQCWTNDVYTEFQDDDGIDASMREFTLLAEGSYEDAPDHPDDQLGGSDGGDDGDDGDDGSDGGDDGDDTDTTQPDDPYEPYDPDETSFEVITVGAGQHYFEEIGDSETFENVLFDVTQDGAGATIGAYGTNWTIRNVGWRGENEHDAAIGCADYGGTSRIENVYCGDGFDQSDELPGVWVARDHTGRIKIDAVNVQMASHVAFHCSAPMYYNGQGRVELSNCYSRNAYSAHFQLGDGVIDGCTAVNTSSGDDARGIWAWPSGPIEVSDCHLAMNGRHYSLVAGMNGQHSTLELRDTEFDDSFNGGWRNDPGTIEWISGNTHNPDPSVPSACPTTPEEAAGSGARTQLEPLDPVDPSPYEHTLVHRNVDPSDGSELTMYFDARPGTAAEQVALTTDYPPTDDSSDGFNYDTSGDFLRVDSVTSGIDGDDPSARRSMRTDHDLIAIEVNPSGGAAAQGIPQLEVDGNIVNFDAFPESPEEADTPQQWAEDPPSDLRQHGTIWVRPDLME